MGKNQLNELENYLKLPGLNTYFRSVANDTLVQIIHHYPEKKEEVITTFEDMISFLVDAEVKDNVIDSRSVSIFISVFFDLKLLEFRRQSRSLFDRGIASG